MKIKSKSVSRRAAVVVESLECRRLLSAGPRIDGITADNRGQVTLQVANNQQLIFSDSTAIQVFVAGSSGNPANSDHVVIPCTYSENSSGLITVDFSIAQNTPYEVRVKSLYTTDQSGNHLDGEFNGTSVLSGNGVAGGNLMFSTSAPDANLKTAIFDTTEGEFEVQLISKTTDPADINNFLKYVNRGLWDDLFVSRAASGFVVQAGGQTLTSANPTGLSAVPDLGDYTPSAGGSNTAFTIAMATAGGLASNQFFFNVVDNSSNLDSGGFRTFGTITSVAGDNIVTAISALQTVDLTTNLQSSFPTTDFETVPYVAPNALGKKNVYTHLAQVGVFYTRVSIAMTVEAATVTG